MKYYVDAYKRWVKTGVLVSCTMFISELKISASGQTHLLQHCGAILRAPRHSTSFFIVCPLFLKSVFQTGDDPFVRKTRAKKEVR
jgi:hypothetical protein